MVGWEDVWRDEEGGVQVGGSSRWGRVGERGIVCAGEWNGMEVDAGGGRKGDDDAVVGSEGMKEGVIEG